MIKRPSHSGGDPVERHGEARKRQEFEIPETLRCWRQRFSCKWQEAVPDDEGSVPNMFGI